MNEIMIFQRSTYQAVLHFKCVLLLWKIKLIILFRQTAEEKNKIKHHHALFLHDFLLDVARLQGGENRSREDIGTSPTVKELCTREEWQVVTNLARRPRELRVVAPAF